MTHHFVTTVHNGPILCHHYIEWHITLSPVYNGKFCVTIL